MLACRVRVWCACVLRVRVGRSSSAPPSAPQQPDPAPRSESDARAARQGTRDSDGGGPAARRRLGSAATRHGGHLHCRVGVGAAVEQEPRDLEVALLGRPVEPSGPVLPRESGRKRESGQYSDGEG